MIEWVVFYDSVGNELGAYTKKDTFVGELKETAELLAYENEIPVSEIIIKVVKR